MSRNLKIVECPRDAMQGWKEQIPTATKIAYIQSLLAVGFDTIDFGSFVSPKAIPQMADTTEVLASLDLSNTNSKLLAIVANTRGASEAATHRAIDYLGFPFSISETFQIRNTNKSIADSLVQVQEIQDICHAHDKELVVYISMGFGNPYGDPYTPQLAIEWVGKLHELGIRTFAMSDTIGVAKPEIITPLFTKLIPSYPDAEIGAHFHSTPHTRLEKLEAAYQAGCHRFDSAINGIGGCPMAKDDLVGNMATEDLLLFAKNNNITNGINMVRFSHSQEIAKSIFSN